MSKSDFLLAYPVNFRTMLSKHVIKSKISFAESSDLLSKFMNRIAIK